MRCGEEARPAQGGSVARDIEKYLSDVSTIKKILREGEDRVLLRPWAFYAWAAIIVVATYTSTVVTRDYGWAATEVAFRIWPATILIGGVFELIGWVQYLRREEPVVITSGMVKLLLSFAGVVVAVSVVAFTLVARGVDISAVVVLLIAICFFVLAVFTFKNLFFEAYAVLLGGIGLVVFAPPPAVAYQIAGYGVAAVFLVSGLHTRAIMKRREG